MIFALNFMQGTGSSRNMTGAYAFSNRAATYFTRKPDMTGPVIDCIIWAAWVFPVAIVTLGIWALWKIWR